MTAAVVAVDDDIAVGVVGVVVDVVVVVVVVSGSVDRRVASPRVRRRAPSLARDRR